MSYYFVNELRLDLPNVDNLVDHTVHALDIATLHGDRIRFATTRQLFRPGDSLHALIDRSLADKERRMPSFRAISRVERAYAWAEGVEVRFTCTPADEPLFHHQFHCGLGELWLTMTAVAPLNAAARCDAWMVEMLEAVTVRR